MGADSPPAGSPVARAWAPGVARSSIDREPTQAARDDSTRAIPTLRVTTIAFMRFDSARPVPSRQPTRKPRATRASTPRSPLATPVALHFSRRGDEVCMPRFLPRGQSMEFRRSSRHPRRPCPCGRSSRRQLLPHLADRVLCQRCTSRDRNRRILGKLGGDNER